MVINFGAGPAKLPEDVLIEVQRDLIKYGKNEMSVMELSHRGSTYMTLHENTIKLIKDLLNVPDNYKILLMQGGGTGMFAAICMNLMDRTGSADYLVTGTWSAKAAKEAEKYGKVNLVLPKANKYTCVPDKSTWKLNNDASYVYYCDNETVHGVEFDDIPDSHGVPLVVDMSSNIMSRPFDVRRFGLIFGGAQKNIGTAGITVAIIREDLIGHAMKITPSILDFAVNLKENSMYNTPPTFIIYVMGCVFEWIKKKGGVEAMHKAATRKSQIIYKVIADSNGFYYCPIDTGYRSRMNVPFRIGGADGNENLEKEFLKGAESKGMVQLKGHRSVGGIRASLYNAITVEETQTLADYMEEFYKNNK